MKPRRHGIIIKTEEQIGGIRKSGRLTRDILNMVSERIRPGITTNEINQWVHDYTIQHGAVPAPLNYRGYPKSVCVSLNDVICHGIPDNTCLMDGDIVNVDVTCILDGYYADASRMFFIGDPSEEAAKLVRVAGECLRLGIGQVKPGNTFGDIGHVIEQYAVKNGFSVVREYCGHGTGLRFHEEPTVEHYGRAGTGEVMKPGMVFTIEPMINAGRRECKILSDGWTAVTEDGSLSAQWAHTVRVTDTGVEILTD
jgi:methionyl aminopeptidase